MLATAPAANLHPPVFKPDAITLRARAVQENVVRRSVRLGELKAANVLVSVEIVRRFFHDVSRQFFAFGNEEQSAGRIELHCASLRLASGPRLRYRSYCSSSNRELPGASI